MDGVLVIDKPAGLTSHDVVVRVKRTLGAGKVGHLGTLDPAATGVLPLVIDRATRHADLLSGGRKEYLATMKLGTETDTYDAEGRVTATGETASLSVEDVERALKSFVGRISQVPPMFSAVKKNGVPLYKLARKGIEVEREPKEVEIFSVDVVEIGIPLAVFRLACSRGTYLRTICFDAGRVLGCGAHLAALERTRSGRFSMEDAIALDSSRQLMEESIMPLASLVDHAPGGRTGFKETVTAHG